MSAHIHQFRQAIESAGLPAPSEILDDGKLYRFSTSGKRGGNSGWYSLHGDGIPAGAFGCWRSGLHSTWCAKSDRDMSADERQANRERIETMKRQRDAEQVLVQAQAAQDALSLFNQATPATQHPYLTAKGIKPHGARLAGERLLIPLRDTSSSLHSLQTIEPDGGKRFHPGGRVNGCYFSIGKPDGRLVVCEGFATGASIHECTGQAVAVAFNAGNLEPVAVALRAKYPGLAITIAADDDWRTPDNPGLTKAKAAALAVEGKLAVPAFPTDRADKATDFNDLHQLAGADAVRRCFDDLQAVTATAGEFALSVNLIRACDITPEPIAWLWDGWLAAGKMHIFGGAPGTGKTTISMSLAAIVSTGGHWPDGSQAPAGNVVVWSGEDDPADTLIPRLSLSGADLSRVFFIDGIRDGSERRSFDPARDMDALRRKLADIGGVRLLIVDPVVSAIAGDSHKNAEVRRGLQPLADLAASMRCALLGITHFSKGTGGRDPVERLTGSLAFGALARVVLVAAKHQEEGEDGRTVRLFCRAKSNIGPDDGGFEYDLHQSELKAHPGVFASSVLWGTAVEGAARELLATADATGDDGEGGTLADAKRFLADLLADGPMRAGEIFKDADQAGYSKRSIQRAAQAIKVDRRKDGMRGGWTWRLPLKMPSIPEGAEDAEQKSLAPLSPSASSSLVEVEI